MNPGRKPLPPPRRPPLPTNPARLPPLPERYHDALAGGLTTLGLDLLRPQLDALEAYVRLLLAWTEAINLTAISEPAAVAREHLLDSLSAVALLRDASAQRILDLGSGAGLPGLPIAIAMPEARLVLVESIAKKAAFLRTAVQAVGVGDRVDVAAERVEALANPGREREAFDAVTARAVAGLSELVELAFPLLRIGGRLVAWKREPRPSDVQAGREPLRIELAAGREAARTLGGDLDVVPVALRGLDHHRLVVVTKRRATPARFPRSPAERRQNPM